MSEKPVTNDTTEQKEEPTVSSLTVKTIFPNPIKRPDNDLNFYFDKVRISAYNATYLLGLRGLQLPTSYGDYVRSVAPQLLDEQFCLELTNGLETEIRNNYLLYTETKGPDRYTAYLRDVLAKLDNALNALRVALDHIRELEDSIKAEYDVKEGPRATRWHDYINNESRKHYEAESNALTPCYHIIKEWKEVLERLLAKYSDFTPDVPTSTGQELGKLKYVGKKTDLAELVWSLASTQCIRDTTTGSPVTIDELARQFSSLLGVDKLDVDGLVSKRHNNTNKPIDGKTFIDQLLKTLRTHPAYNGR